MFKEVYVSQSSMCIPNSSIYKLQVSFTSKKCFLVSMAHIILLHEDKIQNLGWPFKMRRVCLTCAHATNQQKMRISHVHEVNNNRIQLLSMSHNHTTVHLLILHYRILRKRV